MLNETIIPSGGAYSNIALDKYVESKVKEYQREATILGATLAIKNIIRPDTSLAVITEEILGNFNSLIVEAHKHNEGFLNIAQGKMEIEKLTLESHSLLKTIEKLEPQWKIEKLKVENFEIPSYPHLQCTGSTIICVFIFFTDAYFLGTAFQESGSGLGISILLGLGISLSIAVIATLGVEQLQRIQNKTTRLLALIGLVSLVGGSVFVLAQLRNQFYTSQTGHDIGASKLALLSILTFTAFHLLYKFLIKPLLIRIAERREALAKLGKVIQLETQLKNLNDAYSYCDHKINRVKQLKLSILAYSKSLEIAITRMYRKAIAQFKKAYIEESCIIPDFFQDEVPDLTRFYDDIHLTPITPSVHDKQN